MAAYHETRTLMWPVDLFFVVCTIQASGCSTSIVHMVYASPVQYKDKLFCLDALLNADHGSDFRQSRFWFFLLFLLSFFLLFLNLPTTSLWSICSHDNVYESSTIMPAFTHSFILLFLKHLLIF